MTSPARVCGIDETCNDAARKMWDGDCGFVVVTDRAGRVAGVVTDRDLCMGAWTSGKSLAELPVTRVMATAVRTIRAGEDIATALAAMAEQQVHRLPVVAADGSLCGVVSLTDIVRSSAVGHDVLARSIAKITSPRTVGSESVKTGNPTAPTSVSPAKSGIAAPAADPVLQPPTPAAKKPASPPPAAKPAAKRKSR
ncbi:MAG: CBS domain-containing protein [Planctomycetota bacterium]